MPENTPSANRFGVPTELSERLKEQIRIAQAEEQQSSDDGQGTPPQTRTQAEHVMPEANTNVSNAQPVDLEALLEKKLAQLETARASSDKIKQLEDAKANLEASIASIKGENDDLGTKLASATAEIESLKTQLAQASEGTDEAATETKNLLDAAVAERDELRKALTEQKRVAAIAKRHAEIDQKRVSDDVKTKLKAQAETLTDSGELKLSDELFEIVLASVIELPEDGAAAGDPGDTAGGDDTPATPDLAAAQAAAAAAALATGGAGQAGSNKVNYAEMFGAGA